MSDVPPLPPCRFRNPSTAAELVACSSDCINQPVVHSENCRRCRFANAVCGAHLIDEGHEVARPVTQDVLSRLAMELTAADAVARDRATAATCAHRSADPIRVGACDQCGRKGQPFGIYSCRLHGECSPLKYHKRIRACAHCDDFLDRGAVTRLDISH